MKVLIVGAGVAGLAIAWRLAQAGCSVEVLERSVAGRGASWAAAGMIAPGAEMGEAGSSTAELARTSQAAWPGFAAELEAASGLPISYRVTGSLFAAEEAGQAERLKASASGKARWLDGLELCAREALLAPNPYGGLYNPDDAQVDNRALVGALCVALKRAGGNLREHCRATSAVVVQDRVRSLATTGGGYEADAFVLANGAWMNDIGGVGAHVLPQVKPVKGQMLAFEPPAGVTLPNTLLWTDRIYLVTRQGRLWAGASVEDAGFDLALTREAHDELFAAACRLVPSLAAWRLVEMWSGLRPRTPDDAPVLGATEISNLYVAGGQFRNGILFAPLIGDLVAAQLLGNSSSILDKFDPKRFGRAP